MPDLSLYVRQTPIERVEATVEAWQIRNERRLAVSIEEADEFPGYTVAVDVQMSDETELRRVLGELAAEIGDATPEWEITLSGSDHSAA